MIRHENGQWILYTSDGSKVLGRHATKAGAERQEAAINIAKARKAGHRVPKKK